MNVNNDVLIQIILKLPFYTILQVSTVNLNFYNICNNEGVLKLYFFKNYNQTLQDYLENHKLPLDVLTNSIKIKQILYWEGALNSVYYTVCNDYNNVVNNEIFWEKYYNKHYSKYTYSPIPPTFKELVNSLYDFLFYYKKASCVMYIEPDSGLSKSFMSFTKPITEIKEIIQLENNFYNIKTLDTGLWKIKLDINRLKKRIM